MPTVNFPHLKDRGEMIVIASLTAHKKGEPHASEKYHWEYFKDMDSTFVRFCPVWYVQKPSQAAWKEIWDANVNGALALATVRDSKIKTVTVLAIDDRHEGERDDGSVVHACSRWEQAEIPAKIEHAKNVFDKTGKTIQYKIVSPTVAANYINNVTQKI